MMGWEFCRTYYLANKERMVSHFHQHTQIVFSETFKLSWPRRWLGVRDYPYSIYLRMKISCSQHL
jgi:hypothetical protein